MTLNITTLPENYLDIFAKLTIVGELSTAQVTGDSAELFYQCVNNDELLKIILNNMQESPEAAGFFAEAYEKNISGIREKIDKIIGFDASTKGFLINTLPTTINREAKGLDFLAAITTQLQDNRIHPQNTEEEEQQEEEKVEEVEIETQENKFSEIPSKIPIVVDDLKEDIIPPSSKWSWIVDIISAPFKFIAKLVSSWLQNTDEQRYQQWQQQRQSRQEDSNSWENRRQQYKEDKTNGEYKAYQLPVTHTMPPPSGTSPSNSPPVATATDTDQLTASQHTNTQEHR
jgi:hypothetical protein